ncbi:MAG TPA: protein kinase [Pirellulaceae bacterium]|nr:protein kinase [Pirellulaceae bacterium]HMP71190.1 protein kinase [Pirellulaceae bacterium]
MPQNELSWRLGVFAWEADLVEAEQLATAVSRWSDNTELSLLDLVVEGARLSADDVRLLHALWSEHTQEMHNGSTQAELEITYYDQTPTQTTESPRDLLSTFESRHRFELISPLASGGLGKVSIAKDKELNRHVAIKEMLPNHANNPESCIRFAREAEITSQLEHPAIVPIHSLGLSSENVPFYSMRLIKGRTLRELAVDLKQKYSGPERFTSLEFRRLLSSFITVCQAVEHAHSRHIIHRDIKPANVIVGEHGESMLVDWGLAKLIKDATETLKGGADFESSVTVNEQFTNQPKDQDFEIDLTTQGVSIGTPAYMSPEQANDAATAGRASDVFSLGATLYFLLTGQAPYRGTSSRDVLAAARHGVFSAPRKVCPSIPKPLEAICQKAMHQIPQERYATPAKLAEEIEKWLADDPVSAWSDSIGTVVRRWIKRNKVWSTAVGVLCIASLLGALLFSFVAAHNNRRLRIANQNEQHARQVADQQGALALQTLKTVAGELQTNLRHIPAAQRVRQKLLVTFVQGLEKVSTNLALSKQIDLNTLIAHRDLGDLYFEIGNIGEHQGIERAKFEFLAARAIAEALVAKKPDDIEAHRQLALTVQRMADIESQYGSTAVALDMRRSVVADLKKLNDLAPHNEVVLRSYGVANNLLGDLLMQMGEIEEAGTKFLTALQVRQDQADRQTSLPEADRDLIVSYNKLADYYSRIGETTLAYEYLRRSLASSELLAVLNPDDFQALRDLSTAHYQLGKHCLKLGKIEEAITHHEVSQELDARRLLLDPANSLAHRDSLESTMQLADTLKRAGNFVAAIARSHEAIRIGENLLRVDPEDRRATRYLAYAHSDLADSLASLEPDGDSLDDEYLPHLESCLALMQRSAALDPDNPRGQWDIAFGLTKFGNGLLMADRLEEAQSQLARAVPILRARFVQHPNDSYAQQNLLEALKLLAITYHRSGMLTQADELFSQADQIASTLDCEKLDNASLAFLWIEILELWGQLHQSRDLHAAAQETFQKALDLAHKLQDVSFDLEQSQMWIDRLNRHLD